MTFNTNKNKHKIKNDKLNKKARPMPPFLFAGGALYIRIFSENKNAPYCIFI